MWTLKQALKVIRMLQPKVRLVGYHIALGGGVLNNGRSVKDLDLYFLPMGSEMVPLQTELMNLLCSQWQIDGDIGYGNDGVFVSKVKMRTKLGQRVDIFIERANAGN